MSERAVDSERVEGSGIVHNLLLVLWIHHTGLYESFERCLRQIVDFFDPGPLADFADEFPHGEAVVRGGIEDAIAFIEPIHGFGAIVWFVSHVIADIMAVLLFHVREVVLFVGAAPGELKALILSVG